jgi:hypothetical protein
MCFALRLLCNCNGARNAKKMVGSGIDDAYTVSARRRASVASSFLSLGFFFALAHTSSANFENEIPSRVFLQLDKPKLWMYLNRGSAKFRARKILPQARFQAGSKKNKNVFT